MIRKYMNMCESAHISHYKQCPPAGGGGVPGKMAEMCRQDPVL